MSRKSVLVIGGVSFGHKGPRGWAEDEYLLSSSKLKSEELVCCPRKHSRKVLLIQISIIGARDKEES